MFHFQLPSHILLPSSEDSLVSSRIFMPFLTFVHDYYTNLYVSFIFNIFSSLTYDDTDCESHL